MKLAKLSLAVIAVVGLTTSSFAADTLSDAFKNGKVTGELKAYYFANEDSTGDRDSIFNAGLMLNYKTATLNGFGLNFTAQGNNAPFADKGAKSDYNGSMYGSGAVLSEAYLSYNIGKTTAQVGRMFLSTPLIAGSGSRLTREAFEGVSVVNTDLPDTTLIAAYVQKFQARTNRDGNIGKFSKTIATGSSGRYLLDDGAYTVAAINKSVSGLTLTAAYADVIDFAKLAYAEVAYEGKVSNVGYNLAAQYYYNNIDDKVVAVGEDDTINAFGLKAGLSFKGVNAYVAYSKTSNDNVKDGSLFSGLGNGADNLFTDSTISSPGYVQNADAYAADLNYDITSAANVGARYVEVDFNDGSKGSYSSVYGSYALDGALKNLKLGVQYESRGKDDDGQDLWFKANYKF